jgi:hypothetical protein
MVSDDQPVIMAALVQYLGWPKGLWGWVKPLVCRARAGPGRRRWGVRHQPVGVRPLRSGWRKKSKSTP